MTVDRAVRDQIGWITVDRREKLNALDLDHLIEFRSTLSELSSSDDVRVIVIQGAGGRSFCTGVDIGSRPGSGGRSYASAFPLDDLSGGAAGIYTRLVDLEGLRIRKPLIAAIDGYCLGGGFEIALQCDLLVSSTGSSFGLPETTLASIPGAGGVRRLLRAIPRSVAMQMILTGERIDAARAFEIGLVSELWAAEEFPERLLDYARRIAENAPMSMAMSKMLADYGEAVHGPAAQQLAELAWGALRDTQDRAEGARAFADRRSPRYEGR